MDLLGFYVYPRKYLADNRQQNGAGKIVCG